MEPETSRRSMDPALQVECDLTHVNFIATANALAPLPPPLRDRLLILEMPEPGAEHLEAVLPSLWAVILQERGQDPCFVPALSPAEIADIRRHWGGGSVRRLRQVVEVVLGVREFFETKH
jgi:hypothetical protein